jgi:hypothetical protein
MHLVGFNYTTNADGHKNTTLQVTDNYNPYYSNVEAGRGCMGVKVDSIYVGNIDCSALKIGMDIDIVYDKAITTARGTFQPIKRIEVVSK